MAGGIFHGKDVTQHPTIQLSAVGGWDPRLPAPRVQRRSQPGPCRHDTAQARPLFRLGAHTPWTRFLLFHSSNLGTYKRLVIAALGKNGDHIPAGTARSSAPRTRAVKNNILFLTVFFEELREIVVKCLRRNLRTSSHMTSLNVTVSRP